MVRADGCHKHLLVVIVIDDFAHIILFKCIPDIIHVEIHALHDLDLPKIFRFGGSKGSQAVHTAPNLILAAIKGKDQFACIDPLIRIIRHFCRRNIVQNIKGTASGKRQSSKDSCDPRTVFRCSMLFPGNRRSNVLCGKVDNSLMISRIMGKNHLEGLLFIIAVLLDPGSDHRGICRLNSRDAQIIPF